MPDRILCNKEIDTKPIYMSQIVWISLSDTLQWCHDGYNGISNHLHLDVLLNHLFRCRSKKTSTLYVIGLCEGNSPHKGPVTLKMLPIDDVIMRNCCIVQSMYNVSYPKTWVGVINFLHSIISWFSPLSLITCWISHSYLTGVAAAQLWWHMPSIKIIQRCFLQDQTFPSWKNWWMKL